jgi:cyclopropane fatty-acyl-phospholipid synthase-like methyltransferase
MNPVKPFAPHCERNKRSILAILETVLPSRHRVLEIGSGTGQHAVFFAPALHNTVWQTSDVEENLPDIQQWLDDARLPTLPPPLSLDVNGPWPDQLFDAAFTANTLHIMSWPEVEKLFAGLNRVLHAHATLIVYGPFNYGHRFTSDSNRAFDAELKVASPMRGIRDFEAVDRLARAIGLALIADHPMPSHNHLLVWER